MQFWPGVRPNQRQRALGDFLYRATVGRTVQKYGQRLLDRYGNYTVRSLKRLASAAGALPGTNTTRRMAYRKYGARTRRRQGGARKRWVRRSYVGRKRTGMRIPQSLRRYITKMANSGKERLHKSFAGTFTGVAEAKDVSNRSSVWTYYQDMNGFEALQFRQGSTISGGDDQVDFHSANSPWAFQSLPVFNGDYIFIKKTSVTFEITLNDFARNWSKDDPADDSASWTNFPWIVRFIAYKPKDSNEDDQYDLFRTLNGDKIGFVSYRTPANDTEAYEQQLDMRNMITKGILNKKDFTVVKDIRFQLGAGNVASCVSKKIPVTFNFNKNEKVSTDVETSEVVDLAAINDANNDNARRARYYNYRFLVMAVPSVPTVGNFSSAPINVAYHGVTLGHD